MAYENGVQVNRYANKLIHKQKEREREEKEYKFNAFRSPDVKRFVKRAAAKAFRRFDDELGDGSEYKRTYNYENVIN